jgi:hypothetical protein
MRLLDLRGLHFLYSSDYFDELEQFRVEGPSAAAPLFIKSTRKTIPETVVG